MSGCGACRAVPFQEIIFFSFMFYAEIGIAQPKNPTTYPYGGSQDETRMHFWMQHTPLNFEAKANVPMPYFLTGLT